MSILFNLLELASLLLSLFKNFSNTLVRMKNYQKVAKEDTTKYDSCFKQQSPKHDPHSNFYGEESKQDKQNPLPEKHYIGSTLISND